MFFTGDVQSYIGFPNGFYSHSSLRTLTITGYTSRLQCVKMCYNQKLVVSFAVNSATFNDDGRCWCGRYILASFYTTCCRNNIFNCKWKIMFCCLLLDNNRRLVLRSKTVEFLILRFRVIDVAISFR